VAANCVAQGIQPGGTQNPDFDCRGLLVNIDNHIIPLRTTECERQSSQNGADATSLQFQRAARTGVETSGFLEIALVIVRFDHVASVIVNADHSVM
jgi:hypothetical protein